MAAVGHIMPIQLHQNKIKELLKYKTARIVTDHNRDHIFGGNTECSCIDNDIDVYRLVAAVVYNHRHSTHLQTVSSV